jgi:hypothetical protein
MPIPQDGIIYFLVFPTQRRIFFSVRSEDFNPLLQMLLEQNQD